MAGATTEDPRERIRTIAKEWDTYHNRVPLYRAILDVWPVESAAVGNDGNVWIQPLGDKGRFLCDEDLAALPDALQREGYEI